jgi:Activator of Hsp90 ATPase homolog 1-like protein.
MTNTTETRTTQIFRVYIKATPEAIWEAITSPEWNAKYGYPGINEYDLHPGGAFRAVMPAEMVQAVGVPEVGCDGEVMLRSRRP